MSCISDPLDEPEKVDPAAELEEIAKEAEKNLIMMAPLSGASSEGPHIIGNIDNHCTAYIQAIDTSIKTAESGYDISNDVLNLCGLLLDESDAPLQHVKDMQSKAKDALQDATKTLEMFQKVQTTVLESTKEISEASRALQERDESQDLGSSAASNTAGETTSTPDTRQDVELETTMKNLRLAPLDTKQLSDNLDKLVALHARIQCLLINVEHNSMRLKPGEGGSVLRVKTQRRKWTEIKDIYGVYKVKFVRLRGFYPPRTKTAEDADTESLG